jgi:hypothetical protein
MFNSITGHLGTEADREERVPASSFPWVWVGFLFAFVYFVVGVIYIVLTIEEDGIPDDRGTTLFFALLGLPGFIYWLFCIHRLHKILGELTQGRYPISPGEAALKHIIPFYNLYWVFKWPGELSDYVNRRGHVKIVSGAVLGLMLLLSLIVYRLFDGAFGMAALFGVTLFISSKLKAHVKAVKGITSDQLPPLPDPKIFSRPVETSTSPAQEPVEGSGAG